jgi:hypothetical protein
VPFASCWATTGEVVCVSKRFREAIEEDNSSDLLENVEHVRQPSTLAPWSLGKSIYDYPMRKLGIMPLSPEVVTGSHGKHQGDDLV